MALNLPDDIYELKGELDWTNSETGEKFTYGYWYVAVKNGQLRGAEAYQIDQNLDWKPLDEIKNLYKMLLTDKYEEHRTWLEEHFRVDFTEWVRLVYIDKLQETCKWHGMPFDYEEQLELDLVTGYTVPEALTKANSKAKLTMREWPSCQGDPLELGVKFDPQNERLTFFWNCTRHDT